MAQMFKGDATELKFYDAGRPIAETLSQQKTDFFEGAYSCFALGDMLFENNLSPLVNAIPKNIFRESFAAIFEAFIGVGSFESYLTVFRSIFGNDVEVTFTVPAPGKLNIDIVATGIAIFNIAVREIVAGELMVNELIDDEEDFIVFQGVKGLESQAEVENMLFEMVPDGIYTEITLTIGS